MKYFVLLKIRGDKLLGGIVYGKPSRHTDKGRFERFKFTWITQFNSAPYIDWDYYWFVEGYDTIEPAQKKLLIDLFNFDV